MPHPYRERWSTQFAPRRDQPPFGAQADFFTEAYGFPMFTLLFTLIVRTARHKASYNIVRAQ